MRQRSSDEWIKILVTAGDVQPAVAASWAKSFSEFFVGDVFDSGDHELNDFLANIIHESAYLSKLEEDLRYSAAGMMRTWPTRFPNVGSTEGYVFNGPALANKVYGGRFGNVNPGDGWKYRGSGLMMVTFHDNFALVEKQTGLPVVQNPDLLRRPGPEALRVSLAWWEKKIPNNIINHPDLVRKAVNGGDLGLEKVRDLDKRLGVALGVA